MAIDSLDTLIKKKVNLEVREINDSFSKTLKHLNHSGLNIEDINAKFTFFKGIPDIKVPL